MPSPELEDPAVGRVFAVIGTGLQSVLIVGVVITIVKLVQLISLIMEVGPQDLEWMAGHISEALVPTVLVLLLGAIGNVICFVTALASRYREKWFFWSSLLFSVAYMLVLVGIPFFIYLILRRMEYFASVGSNRNEVIERAT